MIFYVKRLGTDTDRPHADISIALCKFVVKVVSFPTRSINCTSNDDNRPIEDNMTNKTYPYRFVLVDAVNICIISDTAIRIFTVRASASPSS